MLDAALDVLCFGVVDGSCMIQGQRDVGGERGAAYGLECREEGGRGESRGRWEGEIERRSLQSVRTGQRGVARKNPAAHTTETC